MLRNPVVGDLVETVHSEKRGKITKVNDHWGWILVEFFDGTKREYGLTNKCNESLRRLNSVEKADLYLDLENAGITDSWRE